MSRESESCKKPIMIQDSRIGQVGRSVPAVAPFTTGPNRFLRSALVGADGTSHDRDILLEIALRYDVVRKKVKS